MHDPLCQFSHPIPGVDAWCSCPALRLARADERERIARAVETDGLPPEHYRGTYRDGYSAAMTNAARIALEGATTDA